MLSLIVFLSIVLVLIFSNHYGKYEEELQDTEEYLIMESHNFAYKAYLSDYDKEDGDWDLSNSIDID